MSSIKITNPYLLILFFPLLLLILLSFIIGLRKKKKSFNNIASLIIHIVLCFLLTLLMADVNIVKTETDTEVYVLADVSKSIATYDEIDNYITNIKSELNENEKLGVVCFGKDSELITPISGKIKSVSQNNVDISATNYSQALSYTSSLFTNQFKKRIILISDGLQTEGDYSKSLAELKNQNIRVDVIYLNNSSLNENEILVKNVSLNEKTFLNKNEAANVVIESNYNINDLIISLYKNDTLYKEINTNITIGLNNISFPLDTSVSFLNHYKVEIKPSLDFCLENNNYFFTQYVKEKAEMLLICDSYKEVNYYTPLFLNSANVTSFQVKQSFSYSLDYLCQFDEIVFANVDLSTLKNHNELLQNINICVSKYGKSFLTLGGEKTYFSGGFSQSIISDMLPINVNPIDTKNTIALFFVIDCSGSMSGKSLQEAKQGAINCLDLLNDNDMVGVITFSDTTRVICAPTKTTVEGKRKLIDSINTIKEEDATMMTPALTMAYNMLKDVKMENKQIILISDGYPGDGGQLEVANKMKEKGIIMSTINIGAGALDLMKKLAEATGGKCYSTYYTDKISDIIVKEIGEIVLEPNILGTMELTLNKLDSSLKNVNSLPIISGINYTSLKYNAAASITTSISLKNQEKTIDDVPVYAYWDYGSGKVSSLMSGLSSDWFNMWDNKNKEVETFFSNIIFDNLPINQITSSNEVNITNNGHSVTISLTPYLLVQGTKYKAIITQNDYTESANLIYNNLKYMATLNINLNGHYTLIIEAINGVEYNSNSYFFDFSYSSEYYLLDKPDSILLYEMLINDGILIDSKDDLTKITNIALENVNYKQSTSLPIIIICLCLFVIDIAIRKIKLKDIKNLFNKTIKQN